MVPVVEDGVGQRSRWKGRGCVMESLEPGSLGVCPQHMSTSFFIYAISCRQVLFLISPIISSRKEGREEGKKREGRRKGGGKKKKQGRPPGILSSFSSLGFTVSSVGLPTSTVSTAWLKLHPNPLSC
jgi:hypothetical protein